METVNVTVRMERQTRDGAAKLFSELGISTTQAINMFLKQAVRERGIPFKVAARPAESLEEQNRLTASAVASKEDENGSAKKAVAEGKITWKQKLSWLTAMLWGGAALLALEHIWHGEVVLYPPFLTAMSNAADTSAMLHEMSTVGVAMAATVTVIWIAMVLIADHVPAIKKKLAGGVA